MDIDLIVNKVILKNNNLSEEEREKIIYELINIYHQMPNPDENIGINTFIDLSDKKLVLTLVSAYEINAINYFSKCGIDPDKIDF